MAARAEQLGDAGDSAPERWEPGLGTARRTSCSTFTRPDRAARGPRAAAARSSGPGGAAVVGSRRAVLQFGREHFGFSDGFSQPAIQGGPRRAAGAGGAGEPAAGARSPRGVRARPPRRGGRAAGGAGGAAGATAATSSTASSTRTSRASAATPHRRRTFPGGEELLAAKIVGRWRDGTPLAVARAPGPGDRARREAQQRFRYGGDPDGMRCPLGAHIRRTNPRHSLGCDGKLSRRHRIVRRGMPYGQPLPEGADDDGSSAG